MARRAHGVDDIRTSNRDNKINRLRFFAIPTLINAHGMKVNFHDDGDRGFDQIDRAGIDIHITDRYESGMNDKRTNPNFLNGVPDFLVLNLLSKHEMYGYEIVRKILESTHETISFQEGCVYPTLHSLESENYVSSSRKEVNGRCRYYYRLTPRGRRKLEKMTVQWVRVTRGISFVLGGSYAEPATS